MNQSLEELADAADSALAALTTRRTFEEARAALNEAGMLHARRRVDEALARIGEAQVGVREAAQPVSQAKDQLDQALAEAEWALDARFVVEGAKTFLVDGDEKRAMTADARKEWKQREARKFDTVHAAVSVLAAAERGLSIAKDELVLAEKAFSAARADLDAAIATVQLFAQALPRGEQR